MSDAEFPRPGVQRVLTPRLRGEPVAAAHVDVLAALLGDPRVGATLGGTRDRDEAAAIAAMHAAHWTREGFGYWLWSDRRTGEPVGRGGLQRATPDGEAVVELGWAVTPARWGEGMATEMGAAAIAAAARLGEEPVVAYTLPGNVASRRVMEKLGMRYEKTFVHGQWGLHVLYRRESHDVRKPPGKQQY